MMLYDAVDVDINYPIYVPLYPPRNNVIASIFLSELRENYQVEDALYPVDGATWL
jgi:transposase-like protein